MNAEVLRREGEALYTAGKYDQAEVFFRKTLSVQPGNAINHYNLGIAIARQHHYREALECFQKSLRYDPGLSPAYSNLGFCLTELGAIDLARQAFATAHHLTPDDPMPVLNEGMALLTLGFFEEGWKKFEARWHRPEAKFMPRLFSKPVWRGEDLKNRTILLHAEEGFGDNLQMVRYAPLLEQRGAEVVIQSHPALLRLFQSLPSSIQVISSEDTQPAFDFHAPMLSLPIGFRTTPETVPSLIPYLTATPMDIHRWSKIIPPRDGKRIGLAWSGRPSHERDYHRSLPCEKLQALLRHPEIVWISLQQNTRDQDRSFFMRNGGIIPDMSFCDFADTAGMIMNLDYVISVDTSIAHLAGALGKKVWLMLPYAADWRWMLKRQDSPWYPSMRLFRQTEAGNWDSVIRTIEKDLISLF